MKKYLFILLLSAVTSAANAEYAADDSMENDTVVLQEKKLGLGKRLNNKLSDKYYKTKYDLHTKTNNTLGLEVNYCDVAATISINPAKIGGDYNDYEFNFEYHGQQLSFDVNYQRANSLAGDIQFRDIDHLDEDGLRMNVVNVSAYYSFNHRRFSFPAALFQNYYQLRSAGSWLAGLSFQSGSIKTTDELKARSPLAPEVHLTFANVALGGGYGYNFVFGKHSQWLFHLSALPSVVLYKHNRLTVNGDEMKDHRLCFILPAPSSA